MLTDVRHSTFRPHQGESYGTGDSMTSPAQPSLTPTVTKIRVDVTDDFLSSLITSLRPRTRPQPDPDRRG